MRRAFLALLLCCAPMFAQTGNACSSNTSAATGSIQSYAFCQPLVINGRNSGGWIALNRTGDQSNGELQCYNPQNVFIQDGLLTIVDRALTQTCQYFPATTGSGSLTQSYVSAFVQWNTFRFTFGDILIRAKGPSNVPNGGWPALWLLGANCEFSSKVTADNTSFNGSTCAWSAAGSEEIDIFEQATGSLTTSTCNLFAGTDTHNTYTISDASAAFHIYELRWTSGVLQWFYDGVQQTGCNISAANVPSTPMFLQMNVAMSSTATSTGLPSAMQIDWVKVCQPSPCNGNGGNIVFYDDFVTPIAPSLARPMAKIARLSGNAFFAGVFTFGIAKNELSEGLNH